MHPFSLTPSTRFLDDYLFAASWRGHRPALSGADWMDAASGAHHTVEEAVALLLVTVQEAGQIAGAHATPALGLAERLPGLLEARGGATPEETALRFADLLRRELLAAMPALAALGEEAEISLVMDVYRRFSTYVRRLDLRAAIVIGGDGLTRAILRPPSDPTEARNVIRIDDRRRQRALDADALHCLSDSVHLLAGMVETGYLVASAVPGLAAIADTAAEAVDLLGPRMPTSTRSRLLAGAIVLDRASRAAGKAPRVPLHTL